MFAEKMFLEGYAGEGIVIACGFLLVLYAIWRWLFRANIGRRRIATRVFIRAPKEDVWNAYVRGPQPEGGWFGGYDILESSFLEGAPIREKIVQKLHGYRGAPMTLIKRYSEFNVHNCYRAELESMNGVAISAGDALEVSESFQLQAQDGGCLLTYEIDAPVRGYARLIHLRQLTARGFARLRAHCEGTAHIHTSDYSSFALFAVIGLLMSIALMWRGDRFNPLIFLVLCMIVLQLVVMTHEFGHWIALRLMGHSDARMSFVPLFGHAGHSLKSLRSQYEKALIAIMGPAVTALILVLLSPTLEWILGVIDVLRATPTPELSHAGTVVGWKALAGGLALGYVMMAIFYNLAGLLPFGRLEGARLAQSLATSRDGAIGAGLALIVAIAACLGGVGIATGASSVIVTILAMTAYGATEQKFEALKPMTARQMSVVGLLMVATFGVYGVVGKNAVTNVFGDILVYKSSLENARDKRVRPPAGELIESRNEGGAARDGFA